MLAITPGPDNLFVLTQAALRGVGSGLMVVLGLCTGLILHTSLVAFGVAAIFQSSELAFSLLKYVGAGYLIYLAWGAFRAGAAELDGVRAESRGLGAMYRRGIVMNVTNPKVSIFFLAFLPRCDAAAAAGGRPLPLSPSAERFARWGISVLSSVDVVVELSAKSC